jgi:hypothetical protein
VGANVLRLSEGWGEIGGGVRVESQTKKWGRNYSYLKTILSQDVLVHITDYERKVRGGGTLVEPPAGLGAFPLEMPLGLLCEMFGSWRVHENELL